MHDFCRLITSNGGTTLANSYISSPRVVLSRRPEFVVWGSSRASRFCFRLNDTMKHFLVEEGEMEEVEEIPYLDWNFKFLVIGKSNNLDKINSLRSFIKTLVYAVCK